jgi:hypothetical protein
MEAQATLVPFSAADLTAGWLTAVLQPRYPETIVTGLHLGTDIHGTSTKIRLLVSYNDAGHRHGLPPTMWFKGGFEPHSETEDMRIVYAGEAAFFGQIATSLDNNIPASFAAIIDPGSNRSFLLLEDLLARNATFRDTTQSISPDEALPLIEELATLHAATWNSASLQKLPWLNGGGSLLQSCDIMMSPETWARSLSLPRGQFIRGPLRDFDHIRASVLKVLRSDVQSPTCLVHGDSHIGNAFFPVKERPGFIDWQSTFYGMWAHDVAYFLITALTIEDRRRHERDLLAHYLNELGARGVRLGFDDAWLEYRRHALYSCSWSMCLPEWQAEERCCSVTEKAFAATADLETLNAW